VPTARATALIDYLLGLKDTYAYPELDSIIKPPASGAVKPAKEEKKS
jgi:hypothetical protein